MPAYERAALLRRAAALIERDAKGLAELMTRETGKAIKDSEAEIRRSLETLLLAAEEAIRIEGRHVPLDGSPMGAGKLAVLMRFPVGVVAAITPFNAPFNLAAHKIAPSIAAGNSMVLKPPPQAPLIVHRLVELMVEAGLPPGMLNVVLWRCRRRRCAGRRSARRFHQLHRLEPRRRRDQGGQRPSPRRAGAGRQQRHHRPRRRRPGARRAGVRTQLDAPGRSELRLGAERVRAGTRLRCVPQVDRSGSPQDEARRSARGHHRCRHAHRRGGSAARRELGSGGGRAGRSGRHRWPPPRRRGRADAARLP